MQKLAGADRICVSQETEQLVAGYLELRDIGEAQVAGVSQPVRVFELEGAGALRTRLDLSRARGFSKFVGRSDELGRLEAALEKALAGNGQVLGIVADAGTGKSRLCFEFAELCRSRGLPVRSGSGVAHGRAIPLLPVLQFYRDSFGIVDEDDDFGARQKIAGILAQLDRELLDALPILYDFLGVRDPHGAPLEYSGPELQRRLLALLKRTTLARSEVQPLVILFEDLHWFDPGTETFLENLIDAVDGTRTLLLANYRPEYHADWLSRTYCQQVALAPLGPEAMAELLDDLLGSHPSLAGLSERISVQTGGNPFFVEEVVQTLVESGALEGERGQRRLLREPASLEIPASVQAVLAARIDRLAESEKALLQTAAVIGSEFSASLLERASQMPADAIADTLRPLVQAEFLHETALYPEPEYAFKHPLTQDVAYRSLLRERRVAVHRRVAEGLAELRAGELDEQAALIAHHWEQAEESFEAARWHARAASWRGDNAPEQSRAHWARVCELLGLTAESQEAISLALQARTQLLWQGSRMGMSEEEVDPLLSQGEELAARCDEVGVCVAFFGLASMGASFHRRFDPAERLARRAVEMADAAGIPFLQGMARAFLAPALSARGSLQQMLAVTDEGLRLSPDDSRLLVFQGMALNASGRPREAQDALERAISVAEAADALPWLAMAHGMCVAVEFFLGDVDAALRHGRRSVELEERIGSHAGLSFAYGSLGRALMQAEQWEEARAAIARAIEMGDALSGRSLFNVLNHAAMAEIELQAGNPSAARSATEREIADREEPQAVATLLHLARIRALLALEGATPETRAALDELEGSIDANGAEGSRPLVLLARAEWCQHAGDEEARQGHLREAWRLFQAMGADGALRRMKRDFGDLVG
jgi:tetratricopeptide (TPR) repeat protein